MDNTVKTYGPQKLNREEIYNLNKPIIGSERESIIFNKKKLPTNKSPVSDGFRSKFYQTYKEKLILILLKLFQIEEEEILPKTL